MANLGVRRELRMKLAGHTSEVHDRYSDLELETFRRELSNYPIYTRARIMTAKRKAKRPARIQVLDARPSNPSRG